MLATDHRHQGRWRARYAYIDAALDDEGGDLQLCRLEDIGHPEMRGFAPFTYSNERYQYNLLPTGLPFGTPEDALDDACGLSSATLPPDRSDLRKINAVLQ
jgi:hypothetical protein